MKRLILCSVLLAAFPTIAPAQTKKPSHVFATQGDHFTLDGKPFKVLSGELHYARIPREYWHARLKMAKAMGLNTIATYVFWNVHEPQPGHYDFTGQYDLAAFIKAAQEEGLYVILRSGPYACAEWDLGGLPAWLLADPKSAQAIRTTDPAFMAPAERWITRLAKEVLPLQVGRGGPILMTQIENEYGQFGDDHAYIAALRDIYGKVGFNGTDSLLYTADNWRHIPEGSIPGLFAASNFGIGNHQRGMDNLATARPGQALFVSEYWPGWFDHWGHPHETRPVAPQIEDIDYILNRGAGINIYMFHGGTSFGFMAGSSYINDKFQPDVTSYDYDAPLDESGRPTPKYFAYRKELAKFSRCGNESCLPPVPDVAPPITIPAIKLDREETNLWDQLPKPIASALPAPMEALGQNFGYILYRTQLPESVHGDLVIKDIHDFATVYVNSRLAGTKERPGILDRRNAAPDGNLPPIPISTTGPARLDILVANDGRVNVDHTMRTETKGITQLVVLDGRPLSDWQVYTLPMDQLPAAYKAMSDPELLGKQMASALADIQSQFCVPNSQESQVPCGFAYGTACGSIPTCAPSAAPPATADLQSGETRPSQVPIVLPFAVMQNFSFPRFFRANFTLTTTGDTFLDIHMLGKGAVWINGHNLGRFWNVGPQQTLYVPGPWLKTGSNEIVVFDILPQLQESVRGLDHPILDGPVSDKTVSNQE
ncbi:MAG: beta-galactosidase [Acidobacteriaceae bacterium]|jgi:beta-galactosidase